MQVYIMRRPVRLQDEISRAILRPYCRSRARTAIARSPSAQPYATPALHGIAECLGVIAPDARQCDARSTGNIPEAWARSRSRRICTFGPRSVALRIVARRGPRDGFPMGGCRDLIRRMAAENCLWGAPRIHGELRKLGIAISERTVSRSLRGRPTTRSQTWRTFLREPCP